MVDVKIKNAANVQVVAKNIDTVNLLRADGGTATFRQWNGVTAFNSVSKINAHFVRCVSAIPVTATASAKIS